MSPLEPGTTVLVTGRVDGGQQEEPVAWLYRTWGGGQAFYTSLGHPDEFEAPWFQNLLANGIYWAGKAGLPAIGFAPGDEVTAHTVMDSVKLDDVVKATEFYALLPGVLKKG